MLETALAGLGNWPSQNHVAVAVMARPRPTFCSKRSSGHPSQRGYACWTLRPAGQEWRDHAKVRGLVTPPNKTLFVSFVRVPVEHLVSGTG